MRLVAALGRCVEVVVRSVLGPPRDEVASPERDHAPARGDELRRAMAEGELELFYQPIAELRTGRVISVEALIRWHHPERGLLLPQAFLPEAERAAMLEPLNLAVLEQALLQISAWRDEGADLSVSVNFSGISNLDRHLPREVGRRLHDTGADASALTLEVTEDVIMANPELAHDVLAELSQMGVTVSIDDFGVGYSSLARLTHLPFRELKIDKSFVADGDRRSLHVVKVVTELGHEFECQVVAEGVEDPQTWAQLGELGCDLAQGNCLSPPLPAAELVSWLEERVEQQAAAVVRPDPALAAAAAPWSFVRRAALGAAGFVGSGAAAVAGAVSGAGAGLLRAPRRLRSGLRPALAVPTRLPHAVGGFAAAFFTKTGVAVAATTVVATSITVGGGLAIQAVQGPEADSPVTRATKPPATAARRPARQAARRKASGGARATGRGLEALRPPSAGTRTPSRPSVVPSDEGAQPYSPSEEEEPTPTPIPEPEPQDVDVPSSEPSERPESEPSSNDSQPSAPDLPLVPDLPLPAPQLPDVPRLPNLPILR